MLNTQRDIPYLRAATYYFLNNTASFFFPSQETLFGLNHLALNDWFDYRFRLHFLVQAAVHGLKNLGLCFRDILHFLWSISRLNRPIGIKKTHNLDYPVDWSTKNIWMRYCQSTRSWYACLRNVDLTPIKSELLLAIRSCYTSLSKN